MSSVHAMGPSKQINPRTSKSKLARRLDGVADSGLEAHNQQVLWEYYLDPQTKGTKTVTKDLWTNGDREWTWVEVPKIDGTLPWLIFLYGGKFLFEDMVENRQSLEIYDYPTEFSKIGLFTDTRILLIFKG